jgi:hypothetical protein
MLAGIVLTNDGHAILREIDVTHPAAKVGLPTLHIVPGGGLFPGRLQQAAARKST